MMSSWPVWLFAPTSRYLSKRNAKLHSRHNRWNSLCVRNDKYRTSTKDFPTPNGPSTLTLVYPRCREKLLSCWSRFEAARNICNKTRPESLHTYIQAASQLALVTLLSLLKFHKRSQVVHRKSSRSPGENVTLVWPQEHLSCPWFCYGGLQAQNWQQNVTLCLQSTTSCCIQDCGPVQSVSLGSPWWCHPWSQRECPKTAKLSSDGRSSSFHNPRVPGHCLELYHHWNGLPLLVIHGALPWHPTCNHLQSSLLHTAVRRWLSGLFHRIAPIAR